CGRLACLWHDLGKFSDAFQTYLRASADSDGGSHTAEILGRVDHSTAGAQHAVRESRARLGRFLAYCIAGHHAGLPVTLGPAVRGRVARHAGAWIETRSRPATMRPAERSLPTRERGLKRSKKLEDRLGAHQVAPSRSFLATSESLPLEFP